LRSVKNVLSLDSVRKKDGRRLDRFHVIICNLLFTSFLSNQVSIFTNMHSVHFSALSMHYPQCKTLPVRTRKCLLHHGYNAVAYDSWCKCRLLHHGYNDIAYDSWRKCRLLHHGYNAVTITLGPAAILCLGFCTGS